MNKKTIKDIDLKDKKVLVRCDFNDLFNKINWMLWCPVQDNYIANDIFCFVDTNNSKRLLEWLIRRYQNNGI